MYLWVASLCRTDGCWLGWRWLVPCLCRTDGCCCWAGGGWTPACAGRMAAGWAGCGWTPACAGQMAVSLSLMLATVLVSRTKLFLFHSLSMPCAVTFIKPFVLKLVQQLVVYGDVFISAHPVLNFSFFVPKTLDQAFSSQFPGRTCPQHSYKWLRCEMTQIWISLHQLYGK